MTVSSTTSRNEYNGNAATTSFAYTFRILDEDHIAVYVDDVLQTITTDYTVTDVGVSGGGDIEFVAAPATGTANVIFLRSVPLTQETDYVENDPFPAESHEDALDKLTMITQQQQEQLDRALTFLPTSPVSSVTMPDPSAGKALLWNATEDALENSADNFNDIVTAAAASAAAALVSQNAAAADVVLTHADVVLTHADVVLTHADVVLTHADVVLTHADVITAAGSASAAGLSESAAALSETNAGIFASAAAASESGVAADAAAASVSAAAALASETAALASETAAAASELNAASSAVDAAGSAATALAYSNLGLSVSGAYDFGSVTDPLVYFPTDFGALV